MTEDAIFKEQWNLLKKEMAMGDAHLQQRLEQFIFRQYGRAVLTHYIKALSVLELSRHFYLRFRRRSRAGDIPAGPRPPAEAASSRTNGTPRNWKPPISSGCARTARTVIMPT